MRDWVLQKLLRTIKILALIVGRLIERDVGEDGKDKRTGSQLR